jgi:hypothetical protein
MPEQSGPGCKFTADRRSPWYDRTMAFAPGESPFHVKGGVYLGTIKFFTRQVEGGVEALHKEIDDPRLLAFIQQKFLPSSWYDVLPVAPLIRAEARAMKLTTMQYLKQRTAFQVREDIGGVYRMLLKLISPESVAMRLPRLLTQIFDHGQSEARLVEPGWIESTLSGYPKILWEWYSTAFEIYSETAIGLAGGKKVSALARPPDDMGEQDGVPLIRFRMDARWEA